MLIGNPIMLGGGSGKAFAVIGVTYPEGSTCTCSDGTKTLKLKDTSGQGFFLIPYAGTWTVMCYDGETFESSANKRSENVTISQDGQVNVIGLSYLVPLEYQAVEYLQSNGSQYIKTGITGKLVRYSYEIKANVSSAGWVLGATASQPYMGLFQEYQGKLYVMPTYNGAGVQPELSLNKDYVLTYACDNSGNRTYTVDGIQYKTTIGSSYVNSNLEQFYLFARNYDGNVAKNFASAKLYYVKIYDENGEIIHHLVPCYRKSDNVAGVFDSVKKVFLTNSGSGTFIVGGDI